MIKREKETKFLCCLYLNLHYLLYSSAIKTGSFLKNSQVFITLLFVLKFLPLLLPSQSEATE